MPDLCRKLGRPGLVFAAFVIFGVLLEPLVSAPVGWKSYPGLAPEPKQFLLHVMVALEVMAIIVLAVEPDRNVFAAGRMNDE